MHTVRARVYGSNIMLKLNLSYVIGSLKELLLQPGLSRDSFFTSLRLADVEFPNFEVLYLGFVDDFPPPGRFPISLLPYMNLNYAKLVYSLKFDCQY